MEEKKLDQAVAIGSALDGTLHESDQDQVWIDAARKGDHRAFNRIVLKWEQRVFNLVLRTLNDREEAAEVTQEVFLSLFRHLERFRGDAKFSTWLYRVAVNHCLTRLRRRPPPAQGLDQTPESELRMSAPGDQETRMFRSEQRRRVLDSLAALSPQQRLVIELKIYQDETFLSIAGILGLPESTVKSRFYAALEILKSRLGGGEQRRHESQL